MASVPIPKLTRTTNLVSDSVPAGTEIICPHCLAANTPLRGGGVKAYIMIVRNERGRNYECASCSKSWPVTS